MQYTTLYTVNTGKEPPVSGSTRVAFPVNVGLGWKCMFVTKALAFITALKINDVKSFLA